MSGAKLPEEHRTAVLAASLLHDVGHGPFSHTFEKISGESHEARTLQIIMDNSTDVHNHLVKHDSQLPSLLAAFFDEDMEESIRDAVIAPHLTQVVSSQLDADRFDYLLRDSHATGTEYGRYDLNWLIEHLYLDNDLRRFFLSHKGLMAAEGYVFARYHMYRTVYFHKTTRAAEMMLRLLFQRYKELLGTVGSNDSGIICVPEAPPSIVAAFSGKPGKTSLEEYLALDDYAVSEFLKACVRANDPILQMLGSGLVGRKLFKAVEASEAQNVNVGEFTTRATKILREAVSTQTIRLYMIHPATPPTSLMTLT